jgi:hypothetical protein
LRVARQKLSDCSRVHFVDDIDVNWQVHDGSGFDFVNYFGSFEEFVLKRPFNLDIWDSTCEEVIEGLMEKLEKEWAISVSSHRNSIIGSDSKYPKLTVIAVLVVGVSSRFV